MTATLVAAACLAFQQPPPPPRGPISPIDFTDFGGAARQIPVPGKRATVVYFLLVDCPIANRMAPEMTRIETIYSARGVGFVYAYVDPTVSADDTAQSFTKRGWKGFGAYDSRHVIVRALGPTHAPQAIVVDAERMVRYSGRINDLFAEHNKRRIKPTRDDLRVALDEVLAGKPVANPSTGVVGCDIPRLR